jgi:hypothetical protein
MTIRAWSHFETLFRYDHLPENLQPVSKIFHDAALEFIRKSSNDGPEATVVLRKLWEAKNSAVVHHGFLNEAENG